MNQILNGQRESVPRAVLYQYMLQCGSCVTSSLVSPLSCTLVLSIALDLECHILLLCHRLSNDHVGHSKEFPSAARTLAIPDLCEPVMD